MLALVIFLAVFFAILSVTLFEKWYNPITVFLIFWAIVFTLYSLKLEPYYDISNTAFFAFLIQIFAFFIGGALALKLPFSFKRKQCIDSNEANTTVLNFPLVLFLSVVSIMVLIPDVIGVIEGLMQGMSFEDMAVNEVFVENTTTGIRVFLKIFVMFPTTYAISAITANELMNHQDGKTWILFLLNIVIIGLYSLQHGARVMLIILVSSYITAWVCRSKKTKKSRMVKFAIFSVCVLGLVVGVVFSLSRGIEKDSLLMSIYHYLSGSVPNFDYWISNFPKDLDHYTFGFTSLNGFISPIIILINATGLVKLKPELYKLASQYVTMPEDVTPIGDSVGINAFVTHNYAFFVDGGLIGVFIGNFILAYIVANVFLKMRDGDHQKKSLYIFLIGVLILSFTRLGFSMYFHALALLLITFAYKKKGPKI